MSAPAPAPTASPPAAPPRRGPVLVRLLLVVAFAAVGFVAVWQGFGLAGYGTDAHTKRVSWVCFQLLGFGLALVVLKGWLAVRVLVALAFLGSAGWAWWTVRSSDFKSAMSLREAVQNRDWYKQRLANPTVEEVEQHGDLRGIKFLFNQYPSLAKDLPAEYDRWAAGVTDDIVARYRKATPDDFRAVAALREHARTLGESHPPSAERLDTAWRQWLSDALGAKTNELAKLTPGDWAAFDATAPGRKALAEALPETRDALVRAEAEWVDSSVELLVTRKLNPKPGEDPPTRAAWARTHKELLALRSLDATDARFAKARLRLFVFAHRAAQGEVAAHLEAGRYEAAFGVARTHAVEWDATAAILGPEEQKALRTLRDDTEYLAALAAKAGLPSEPPEVAPPPRTRPEK